MIIIENTIGKSNAEIAHIIEKCVTFIRINYNKLHFVWVHVEHEHREVIINTDEHPLLPGHVSYSGYSEGGFTLMDFIESKEFRSNIFLALNLD